MEDDAARRAPGVLGVRVEAGLLAQRDDAAQIDFVEDGDLIGPNVGGDLDRLEAISGGLDAVAARHDVGGDELAVVIGAGFLDDLRRLNVFGQDQHCRAGQRVAPRVEDETADRTLSRARLSRRAGAQNDADGEQSP